MSSKNKKCKNCGSSDVSEFAPRKSVICKNCDNKSTSVTVPVLQNIETEPVENSGLKDRILSLEETVKFLQEQIVVLSKIKKLFPRVFPEENT
jgi:protein-arginine kinase activator protein McsA